MAGRGKVFVQSPPVASFAGCKMAMTDEELQAIQERCERIRLGQRLAAATEIQPEDRVLARAAYLHAARDATTANDVILALFAEVERLRSRLPPPPRVA